MHTAAATLLPALLGQAGLPPDPECELVRQVAPFSGVWRIRLERGGATVIYKESWAPLDREAAALRYAESCGIPVPHVIASHQDEAEGVAGILMTDLGQPARPAVDVDGARLAVKVHQATGAGLPVIGARELASMPGRIAERASRHRLPVATIETAAVIGLKARRLAAPAMVQPIGLCHSEWHPESILIDPDGQAHAYDWARAFCGPGLLDLASWHGTVAPPNRVATRVLIEEYVKAGGNPRALDDRAGLPAEAWALGWHRVWAADWFAEQLELGWVADQDQAAQREAIGRHVAEAAELLLT